MIDEGRLAELAAAAGLTAGAIHLEPLDGGVAARIDSGAPFYPASMIKTPLAVVAAAAVEAGEAAWDETLRVVQSNMTVNDAPSPLVAGADASLDEVVRLMLSRSDNVATNMLFDRFERTAASGRIAALGFPGTRFARKVSGTLPLIDDPAATGRNTHPPREACTLFVRLARAELPGSDRIIAALANQYWNAKLGAGVWSGDRFAHKTGDTDEVSHDGGILWPAAGAGYVLVVYTNAPSNDATDRRFAAFMRALRPFLDGGTADAR